MAQIQIYNSSILIRDGQIAVDPACCCDNCVSDCGATGTCDDTLSSIQVDAAGLVYDPADCTTTCASCSPDVLTTAASKGPYDCSFGNVMWSGDNDLCIDGEEAIVSIEWSGAWYAEVVFCCDIVWDGCMDGGDSPLGIYNAMCSTTYPGNGGYIEVT